MKADNSATGISVQSLFDLQTNSHNNGEYLEYAKCREGKPCTHICFSENCDSRAVVCGDIKCNCQKSHKQKKKLCYLQMFQTVVEKVQSKRQSFPDLLKWINAKYDELIDWISEQRETICLKTKLAGLTEAQIAFLTEVYAGKSEDLMGKKVHEVVKDLNLEKEMLEQTEALIINRISDQWKTMTEKIQKQVSAINLLITDACKWDFSVKGLESKVAVTEAQRATVTEMLNSSSKKKVLRYELLYRASENNFEVSKFWEKCNHKADTVTLIHTEFDKVIGGYTPLSWKKENHGSYEEDSSLRSFVFSVTEKTKFTLKESNKGNAIRHLTNYGPIFGGGGCDICVYTNANSNNSWAYIGYSYENSKVQHNTKEGWQFFQGSTENSNFKIKEWEVWQVVFE